MYPSSMMRSRMMSAPMSRSGYYKKPMYKRKIKKSYRVSKKPSKKRAPKKRVYKKVKRSGSRQLHQVGVIIPR